MTQTTSSDVLDLLNPPLNGFSTAAQVKAAMVAAFSDILFDDILVNGNFQDGYEVEFVNDAGGRNQNPLSVNVSGFSNTPATISMTQSTAGNQNEIQHLEVTGTPTFGSFTLFFLGQSINLSYTELNETDLAIRLNKFANDFMDLSTGMNPYIGTPIVVTAVAGGFEIEFTGSMENLNVSDISVDARGLNLFVNAVIGSTGANPNVPASQTITFVSRDENGFPTLEIPTGGTTFTLTFQGETTGAITIDPDPTVTAANIEAALEALLSSTQKTGIEGDFFVTGDFTNGFVVDFNEYQHLSMLGANDPTFGTWELTFLGVTQQFSYTVAIPSAFNAATIQSVLNSIANSQGHSGSPVSVTPFGDGYDIVFLDSGSLTNVVVEQIFIDASNIKFNVVIANSVQGNGTTNEEQTLNFENAQGVFPFNINPVGINPVGFLTNAPAGDTFTITLQGETTQGITISANPAFTAANIDAALEALAISTGANDFLVTGNYTNGFVIEFQGNLEETNVPLLSANVFDLDIIPSTQVGNFDITTVNTISGVFTPLSIDVLNIDTVNTQEGIDDNEIQTVDIANPAGGGTFKLDFGASTNGPVTLDYDATAAEIQAALESLDTIGDGNVSVTGTAFNSSGGFQVEFIGAFRAMSPGSLITIDDDGILIVAPAVTTVAEGTSINEVQEISVAGTSTAGDFFILSFDGVTTDAIPFDATADIIYGFLTAPGKLNPADIFVRGDALTGFEVEFVGRLTTINVPQIVVDDSGLTDSTMSVKTTSVGGYLRGIRGNTISGNSGAGVEIDLEMFTSFYGDLTGNTISSNDTQGINLVAADPTTLKTIDFSLSVDSNTMDDNRGAGVAVTMQDTAAGDVSITNNTITGSRNDNNATTPYAGDAIYVDLIGTDVNFEAFNQLRDLTIDGNYLGTDADGTAGLGNAGNGIGIHIEESTIIDRTQISNNMTANNTGDGLNFHREDDARVGRSDIDPIVGEERAVLIYSNTFTGNSDGIHILAQNGSLTTTDFEIKDNVISTNLEDGLNLRAEADASIYADIINNEITLNTFNGIESTTRTTSYNGTDRRDVSGAWIQNDISNNLQHGIEISGRIGNRNMLFIGLDGVDPVTGEDRGNMIEGNGRDGIQIAAAFDRIAGRVKIANNSILSNQTGGLELLGNGLSSSIDNNLIAFNTGKGVDINSNGQTVFLRNNVITENTSDGLEVQAGNVITHTEDNRSFPRSYALRQAVDGFDLDITTSVTAIGNFIDNNGGRGVDLMTEDQADSDFIFGDGTTDGANRIVSNALEGFYVVTTASRAQDQDADSTAVLDRTGDVTTSDADMVLQVDTNYIQDNGVNSNFSSTGLILRIGTMASDFDYAGQTPGSRVSVGAEGPEDDSNGRSNVSIINNEFEGNYGEDVFIESFTSTEDPPITQDNWDVAATPPFRVLSSYRRDPLAKLNLVFRDNTGNGLDVVNVGAFYDTDEPEFKSRVANVTPPPNPDGPFGTGESDRRRNAQRVASRTNLNPTTGPNLGPIFGRVADVTFDFTGSRMLVETSGSHNLVSGVTVEITGAASTEASDDNGELSSRLSALNGVFTIQVKDDTHFYLENTGGVELSNYISGSGTWSVSDINNGIVSRDSFLYDGMGVSTFRIAQGFDGVNGSNFGDGFQKGDTFRDGILYGGFSFGERSYVWDIWTPNTDTFLKPDAFTFLTADISVAKTDPTTGAIVDPLIISFTEDVNIVDVDLDDFVLLRDNVVVNLLLEGAILTPLTPLTPLTSRTFELDLSAVTDTPGEVHEYELRLITNETISDAKYVDPDGSSDPINFLSFGDVERFTVDGIAPTVEFEEVELALNVPISGAASEVVLNFSEDVTGVALSDFTLTFDDGSGPVNKDLTAATLTQVTGSQFVLDLSKVTSLTGVYSLTLNTGGSITDLAGNAIVVGDNVTWMNDTQPPAGSFGNMSDETVDPLTVDLTFLEDVSGVDILDFKLFNGNTEILLTGATVTAVSDSVYTIDLGGLALDNGNYTLTFVAEDSGVVDDAGNHAASPISISWQNGTDFDAPTVGIQSVTPDGTPLPTGTTQLTIAINFSEDVVNFDAHNGTTYTNLELLFDDGSGPIPIDIPDTLLTGSGSFYTLILDTLLAGDGNYTLTILDQMGGGTIVDDPGGNAVIQGATESWRIGQAVLNATIEGLPTSSSALLTDAGEVTITFRDALGDPIQVDKTEVTILDFRLTRNGQNISLTDLVVEPVLGTSDSTYKIDLSTVTDIPGEYTLTLVAEGSGISAGPDPLLNDVSISWVNGSIISVTELSDGTDGTAGDGVVGNSGDTSSQTLRAAIQEANALAGSNIIDLAAGRYVLDIGGIDEDQSLTGDLDIRDNLTIRGQGVDVTIIDGAALFDRIFQVFGGITLNLENLTITNGSLTGSSDGAGIRNSGTTTLTNVEVTGNVSEDSAGGLNNTGLMIIVDSTISGNMAGGSGGGIRNTGTLNISRSTISGNSTERDGGAIFNAGAGNVTISNSTLSGNQSDRSGGAIRNTATMTAINNTFTLNAAGTNGGAISNSGTSTLQNNLVIGNTAATNVELDGDFISLGGNLTGPLGSATGIGAIDIVNVGDPAPVLNLTLADNGGPTLTHALLLGSMAIDAGASIGVDELEQRGSTRVLGGIVDIGAVEFGAFFVNSFLDTVDAAPGDGIAADVDGNLTLRAAIMEANALAGDSVIILGSGMYDLTILNEIDSNLENATTGDLDVTDITGSLTIIGAGNGQTIINATSDLDDRVFDVLVGAELTLEGVTVTGGHAISGSGGGIRNVGTLSLLNTVVDGNTADVDGGGILNGQLGLQGTLNLLNSTVSTNSAVDGGGIFNNDQSIMTLVDSNVTGNTASNDGGGLFNDLQATIDLTRSSISGNTATLDGGGIYNNDLASLTITDSKVNSNTADQGAGIFNEEAASLTVSRTTVSGNNALLHGGGIYNDEGVVSLSDVSILTNKAASDGGGFYNASAGEVTIINSFFDDNSADRDGGAIANFGVSLSLTGTIIRDSAALRNGGGLFNDQEEGAVNLTSTSLINNEAVAGGGIYNQELGTINLDLSTLSANIASTNGGGIYNKDDATLNLQRTTIDGNIAANDGAGIYNEQNAQLNVFNSTLSNNIAADFGGGIYNNSVALADIANATISGNDASAGGGIYNDEEGSMEITNATIYNNSATTLGGGILNAVDGFVRVANSIIAGNFSTPPNLDVAGEFQSRGNNLIGVAVGVSTGFEHNVNDDIVGSFGSPESPGLGALQDNGGATFTHELLGGSLARDAGNNFFAPVNDQRGFARLFDGDGNGTLIVDIGAFESGYIVTGFTDSVDATPGDGVSIDANGQSTLRAAVMEANARTGADTILLGTGVYTLSLFGQLEDNALLGDLDITDDLTIIGAGSDRTFIDADFLDRIFHIFTDVNVSIRGVTLVNGSVTRVEDGGAILNFGNLTLEDVTIENSLANRGGALFNNGIVNMTDSFFHTNTAIADGGAIFNNNSGTVTIDLSTISGNDAENGGGIFNSAGGTLGVNDTTIDGNTATVAGGGIFTSNEVAVGNGEGDTGVNVPNPASTNEVVIAEGYEEHTSPKYDNGDAEAAILSEAPPFPVSDTFNLSSLPGANHTIYLDFNGHTTTGTPWNDEYGTIVTPAYDTDGNVGSFSLDEIEDIQRSWRRVAEDFAPFNVNVTTVEPPVSDLIKSGDADTRWGQRVVIGENTFYDDVGGVAYRLLTFNYDTDTPTFVFNPGLVGVAETISHEVGHTLGLSHDGTPTVTYYPGHGSGATAWAPIMGAGFLPEGLVQWSQGEYTDASNGEDDLSIITTQNGFSYRADDHGSGIAFASSITDGTASGIVERNTDVDYFQFATYGGDVIIDPFVDSPNLDILAILYDSSGTQIQTSNPIGALNASFTGLAEGIYFVSIEGTGEGDVLGAGYSDYASLGQYTITVSGQPPTLGVSNVTISNSTISNNIAGTRGGGLLNENAMDISNVTFSGNEAGKEGGAIHNTGALEINNSTIYDNVTEGAGGGVYSVSPFASVTVQNTIIAGNHALVSGYDLVGDFTSAGNNLIGTLDVATGFIDGFENDIVGSNGQRVDPVLGGLQDNGGPTFTHALLVGSRAIDAGDNTDGVVIDQRGAIRPTDTTSDIGAYEIVTPTISISDISQVETNSPGTTVFEILVSLSNVNVDDVTVDYETSNGTAVAGIDYEFTTGTVTFSPGETTQTIQVIVNGDDIVEDHETFFVNLFNAVGGMIGDDQSLGTILNDEAEISINSRSVLEGPVGTTTNLNFTVSLTYPVAGVVTVDLMTNDIVLGALAGTDYVGIAVPETLTFNPGDSLTQTVAVVVNGDSEIEGSETFEVELSNATNTVGDATIATPIGIGTILDDDFALLSISDVTLTENFDMGATTTFTFIVSLSQTTTDPVTVMVSTRNGTAISGSASPDDYEHTVELITFALGETEMPFEVTVYTDSALPEDNEFFFVDLDPLSAMNANVADGLGVGTIVENGFVVTTLDDIVDSGDGLTSLREAINDANMDSGLDNIILLPGVYKITRDGAGEDFNDRGDFDIKYDVNIFGQGTDDSLINFTGIDADYLDRIFHTHDGAALNLSNMELKNGDANDGGALFTQGPTTLNQLIFRNNNADFLGGAIASLGPLDITEAQFLNNHAGFQGGALYQLRDTATISRSTFSENTSDGRAGAVYVSSAATFDVSQSLFNNNDSGSRGGAIYNEGITSSTNTTFSANHAGTRGGAIFNDGTLNVLNNTVTLNTAGQSGGGIANNSVDNLLAIATLSNTIVAGNKGALGSDDLDGAYDAVSSFNNLIGNIDAATGLTDGANGNIVGSLLAPIDPILGSLLDNGGPTRTHTLLFGSQAIDAGNTSFFTLGDVDQIGNPRIDLTGAMIVDIGAVELQTLPLPPLFGTGGDASMAEEQTNIQISVVTNRTVVSSDGHTFALPANADWIHEWDSFWVEVWVDTASGFGISDVLTDIAYNTAYFSATAVEFGSNFSFNRTVVIDDEAGVVRNLGGSTIQSNVGGTGHALLARIKFESLAGDQVEVDPNALTIGPLELGLNVLNSEIEIAGVGKVTVNLGALPQTDLYPVIYDINDDDAINFRDLIFFASVYSQDVYSSSSEFVTAMDYNKSGKVDFRDLTLLAANYGKKKSGNTQVNFPSNFGQKWIGTSLEVASGDDSIGQVIEAAVDTWETALGLEEPLEVQVIVRDFGTAQLGSGQTTEYSADGIPVAGRVVIDDDANGLGWHVDVTDLPTGGGYDLYTVLLHEIGHVLGFTRYYSGFGSLIDADNNGDLTFVGSDFTVALDATGYHIEDPAYIDDLMSDTLDPGVRKTPSALNVQMLLEAYQNVGAGSGSGISSPIFGTNSVPTAIAEPTLVQSIEAATVFVEQSTVNVVALAAIKNSEEDGLLVNIRQAASFDAIQPSLIEQGTPFERAELDETIFEDLYSTEFEDSLTGSNSDDRQLVFAHSENELADDFGDDLESMDETFSNWSGPLL